MRKYRCEYCGKSFDPEKDCLCPGCGAAVPPSLMTRIERKETAVRLRAEGKLNYDDHCHEDDSWHESYGAQTHRAAVRQHEAELRSKYAAHKPADAPKREKPVTSGGGGPAPQSWKRQSGFQFRLRDHAKLTALLLFLAPALLLFLYLIISFFVQFLAGLGGSFGHSFP
ncbi:MAG: hypothetical protein IKH07_03155 [Oscillospiraceae bacterium]|nr:hypothetical protein [Oscillospiraceae bacterium]